MGLLSKSTSNQLSKKEILELSKDFDLTTTQIQDLFTHYSQVINNISNAKRQTAGQWITNKVFATLFNLGDDSPLPTFRNYVEKLLQWKSNTQIDRIDFFFSVLDYDQDGVINQSDLSIFIFQKSGYKLQIGDRVCVLNDARKGVLAFHGKTSFAKGKWGGIALDDFSGKNNGTIDGKKYFDAKENQGLFILFKFIILEKHWKDARDILDLFGLPASENSLTLEKFQTKCSNDRWLMNRIMLNPNMKVAKPSKEVVQKS